jgi:hypothetical protein
MRKQAHTGDSLKGVIQKTGLFSLLGLILVSANMAINMFFPEKSKNPVSILAKKTSSQQLKLAQIGQIGRQLGIGRLFTLDSSLITR